MCLRHPCDGLITRLDLDLGGETSSRVARDRDDVQRSRPGCQDTIGSDDDRWADESGSLP
jgi:hypothetical protein